MGRGNGFGPDACMKHTLQADPTVALDEVSLSLVDSLENPFHSVCSGKRSTHMDGCSSVVIYTGVSVFLFALPSGETQACC